MYTFGNIIRQLRKKQHLTQYDLAKGICSQSMLSRIENNEQIPNIVILQQVCEKLDIEVQQLINEERHIRDDSFSFICKLKTLFFSRKYQELLNLIETCPINRNKLEGQEKQMFYYLYAQSLYYLGEDNFKILEILERAESYRKDGGATSLLMIQILSFKGKVNVSADNNKAVKMILKEVLKMIQEYTHRSSSRIWVQLYYEISNMYLYLNDTKKALHYSKFGINLSLENGTFYYLRDLLLLQGIILSDLGNLDVATDIIAITESLKKISLYEEK